MTTSPTRAAAEAMDQNEEGILVATKAKALKAMTKSPTAKNIAAFEKASEALSRYQAKNAAPGEKRFKNALAVLDYLVGAGYKVAKSKLYDDIKAGMIPRSPERDFTQAAVDKYAAANLQRLDPGEEKTVATSERKAEAQAGLLETKEELARIELAKQRGELIPLVSVSTELAARASHLKADIRNWCRGRAAEIITLAEGNPAKESALIRFLEESTAAFFDRYSREDTFTAELVKPAGRND